MGENITQPQNEPPLATHGCRSLCSAAFKVAREVREKAIGREWTKILPVPVESFGFHEPGPVAAIANRRGRSPHSLPFTTVHSNQSMAFHRKQRRRSKQIARCTMKLPILRPSHINNRHPFSCYIFRYTDSPYVISGRTNELRELDWALSRVICPEDETRTARVTYYLSQDDSDIYGTSSARSVHVSAEQVTPQPLCPADNVVSSYEWFRSTGPAPPSDLSS